MTGTIVIACWTPNNYRDIYIKLHGVKLKITKQGLEPTSN